MKTLLVLRHAKSSWAKPGLADHDRPLNDRGKIDAPRMGRLLAEQGLVPEMILCSTAKRARKTAEKVAAGCQCGCAVQLLSDLYLAGPPSYYEALRGVSDDPNRILVVGHNPGMEQLVYELSGQYHRMPTAALAHIDLKIDAWSEVAGNIDARLVQMWLPSELDEA